MASSTPGSANGGSNGAVRTTVATLHVPEPWVDKTTGNQVLPPSRKLKALVRGAVFWEGVEGALQWLALGHFALMLWGFGELMTQQILWLSYGILGQAILSKLLYRHSRGLPAGVPCAKVPLQRSLQKALELYWALGNPSVLILACQTAALWLFYFYQRGNRKDRYFDIGAFPEEGARRFEELLLGGCCLASAWALCLLWLALIRFRILGVNYRGTAALSGAGSKRAPSAWHSWYVHSARHPHLVLDGASSDCGLPAFWSHGDIVSASLERSMSRGGASDGAMGALAILANDGPEGRKQVLQENGFRALVESLANGGDGVQVQAAAAIGSLASDALTMKYGATDLVSCIPALRELARTGPTPDAKEKASGALLNVARSGGAEVQKAIYTEDKLTNQKGLDLLLDLAQNGPTAACKVGLGGS